MLSTILVAMILVLVFCPFKRENIETLSAYSDTCMDENMY